MNDATSAGARQARPAWITATVAGLFGLLYAYAVWNAVAFLVAQATGTLGLNALGWAVLLFAAVFPILVFAAAFAVGVRRGVGEFALALLAGLGLVAVLWLNVLAYAYSNGALLVGG